MPTGSRVTTFLGCGCAAVLALFLAGALSVTFLSYRAGQRLERQADDPAVAARDVRRILPYEELPAGYRPLGALSVPLTFDLAMVLGPAGPATGADGEYDRGFLYVRVRDWLGRGDRTRRWIESGQGDAAPLEQEQIDFAPREVVGRGALTSGRAEITWVARRGDVRVKVGGGDGGEAGGDAAGPGAGAPPRASVLTLMDVECPGDARYERVAIWFAPDPSPQTPTGEQDWAGTPADPRALAALLARFDLCA
ncbi:MAG TPA: hypothetical protein VHQ65_17275 [Thermoanaerobaculia bacterium]|nr:hypothetical protein [Thermoanaerobaculia bacterium]